MYFQIFRDVANQLWRWRLRTSTGEIVVQSEGYTTVEECLTAIGYLMQTNSGTPIFNA